MAKAYVQYWFNKPLLASSPNAAHRCVTSRSNQPKNISTIPASASRTKFANSGCNLGGYWEESMGKTSHCRGRRSGSEETMLQKNTTNSSKTKAKTRSIELRGMKSEYNVDSTSVKVIQQSGAGIKTLNHLKLLNPRSEFTKTLMRKIDDLKTESKEINSFKNNTSKQGRPSKNIKFKLFEMNIGEAN